MRYVGFLLPIAILFSLSGCLTKGTFPTQRTTASSSTSQTLDLPVGAVLPFDSASCPTGWAAFDAGKGRVLIGAGSGNSDADTVALTTRTLGDTGGREYTTGIPADGFDSGDLSTPGSDRGFARSSGTFAYGPHDGSTTINGAKADSNLPPYYVYTICKKTASSVTSITDAIVASAAACGAGTSAATAVSGRVVIGAGSGNNDADGVALTARVLGASGGREYTTGVPATTAAVNSSIPAPTRALSSPGGHQLYQPAFTNRVSIGHATADQANLPPYVVMNQCKASSTFSEASLTGYVVAFDLSSCPTGWSSYSALKGRLILGAGSGNADVDGTALTNRVAGTTGGWEYTVGITGSTNAATTNSPTGNYTGTSSFDIFYGDLTAVNTTFGGAKADSNMPPFYVVTYCTKN